MTVVLCSLLPTSALCGSKTRTLYHEDTTHLAMFRKATTLCVSPDGVLTVLDAGTNEIITLSSPQDVVQRIGGYGWTDLTFDQPRDVIAPNGLDVFVADYGNHRIQRYDRNLNYISTFSLHTEEDQNNRFGYPRSVALDRFGALYIVDGENLRIVKVGKENIVETTFGGFGAGNGRLVNPSRIRVSNADRVYVQDGNRLVVYDIYGNYITSLGEPFVDEIQSFTIEDNTIYILDSCTVSLFDRYNKRISMFSLTMDNLDQRCAVVDLAVRGDTLYLLTEQRVLIRKLIRRQSD